MFWDLNQQALERHRIDAGEAQEIIVKVVMMTSSPGLALVLKRCL
jgi:hypothetical protein